MEGMMELQNFILMLVSLVVGMLGYFLTRLASDIKELEKNINQCQSTLPKEYVLRDDYHRDIDEIKTMLSDMYGIIRKIKK